MNARPLAILDHLSALSDGTRSRLLLLLDRHQLTVTELCTVTQLPQSTVSRHLKALADSGWIAARTEGTSHIYTMTRDDLDAAARRLWLLVREQVGSTSAAAQDQRRLQVALADRRSKSQEFFSSSAGQWDRLRDELFGDRVHLAALAALADGDAVAGDLGCGTGQVSAALAPFVARVIAVDSSAAMLQAAKRRLAGLDNIELRRGELEQLPIDDERLDMATLMLVLHHVPEPEKALAEVARVLKPGGRVIIGDMLPHDRESYRQQMGHVWLGFQDEHLRRLLSEAGFGRIRVVTLAPDPRAKGPGLFVATGIKTPAAGSIGGAQPSV
ncbi:MAG: metalloregulator ArsR/SmtB family transcription factor [Acidobacteriota bacterium]